MEPLWGRRLFSRGEPRYLVPTSQPPVQPSPMEPTESQSSRSASEDPLAGEPRPGSSKRIARWWPLRGPLVYYLLATFDVLTVSGSLYLNHRIMQIYVDSVRDNHVWAQRMADYSGLARFAADVNAPGNDVFDTRDVEGESARMEQALADFDDRLILLRGELVAEPVADEAWQLLERMTGIDQAMGEMAEEARLIFAHFLDGRSSQAGEQMATMDRRYARLLSELRELGDGVAVIQLEHLDEQTAAAAALQRFEYVIAGLILIMVAAATVYGRRIYRQATRDGRERAQRLSELQVASASLRQAHAELEGRVQERTRDLRESEAALGRSAAEWQRTFEAIESPVMVLDALGCARRLNRAAIEEATSGDRDLIGRAIETLGDGEPWQTAARLARQVYEERGPATAQARDDRDGRTWEVAGSLVAAPESADERVTIVARDVTRLIELQDSVRREERMSAMGSLVANVAHEVRNPLFGISATLDAFEARHGDTEPLRKYLPVLRREVDRLGALMRDLLDYGRPFALVTEEQDFGAVLHEAIALCEPSARAADVALVGSDRLELGLLRMDRERIVQVLQNVIENAIQHSEAGSEVAFGVERTRVGDQAWVSCVVRDSGPGFQEEALSKVFEPFFTRRPGGTGLGLSIAQRIVFEHGGRLEASNHRDGGAVVSIRLPVGDDRRSESQEQ